MGGANCLPRTGALTGSSLHQMIPTARSTAAWGKLHLQVCLPLSPPLLHLDLLLPPPLLRLRLPLGHPLHLLGERAIASFTSLLTRSSSAAALAAALLAVASTARPAAAALRLPPPPPPDPEAV